MDRSDEVNATLCDVEAASELIAYVTEADVTMCVPQWRLDELSEDPDDPIRFNLAIEGVALEPWTPAAIQVAELFEYWARELKARAT